MEVAGKYFKLVLEYDGSGFQGWQIQAGDTRTVQGCLIAAVEKIAGPGARVTGSGRTDSGVHAEGQVAAVAADTGLDAAGLLRALNGNLPKDMSILSAEVASPEFDPRRHASSKLYRYGIWNGKVRSPLRAARWAPIPQLLDLTAMRAGAEAMLGVHDFACFQAAGSDVTETVREIMRLEVAGAPGGEIEIEVEGSGFLRHMVRNIAGTLVEIGKGKRGPDSIPALIEGRDRGAAGPTAPAAGLTLVWVKYESAEIPVR
jgi:tRNA pseudouridine38-40 synthase